MEVLRRIDRAIAKREGQLTVLVLLSMVLVAGFSALVRNLTRFDVTWANNLLMELDWTDSFLRKGTMWLGFLGASLATHYRKHISIDVVLRIAPVRVKYVLMTISSIAAGMIALALAYSFSTAVHLNLTERPIEYEVLGDDGSMHVCDASDATLAALEDFERPSTFCVARAVAGAIGIPAETPGAMFQLIVPLMLIIMSIRLTCYGIGSAMVLAEGQAAIDRAEAEEHARIVAVQEATGTSMHPPADESGKTGGQS